MAHRTAKVAGGARFASCASSRSAERRGCDARADGPLGPLAGLASGGTRSHGLRTGGRCARLRRRLRLAPVAQWIEQRFPKPLVGRSSRLGGANNFEGLGGSSGAAFVISGGRVASDRQPRRGAMIVVEATRVFLEVGPVTVRARPAVRSDIAEGRGKLASDRHLPPPTLGVCVSPKESPSLGSPLRALDPACALPAWGAWRRARGASGGALHSPTSRPSFSRSRARPRRWRGNAAQ